MSFHPRSFFAVSGFFLSFCILPLIFTPYRKIYCQNKNDEIYYAHNIQKG